MSTNLFTKKALSVVLVIITFSLGLGTLKHIVVYFRVNRKISQKEKELKMLEEKNLALKVKLQEVQSLKFLDEEARKLLGVGSASGAAEITFEPIVSEIPKQTQVEPSNFKKWFQLFGF